MVHGLAGELALVEPEDHGFSIEVFETVAGNVREIDAGVGVGSSLTAIVALAEGAEVSLKLAFPRLVTTWRLQSKSNREQV